jgi:hypothetical protein
MKTLLVSLAATALVISLTADCAGQYCDTCAPHRSHLYGYSPGGVASGGMGQGRSIRGPVQPFRGLIDPSHSHRNYDGYVTGNQPPSAQTYVHLPREIRERQQRALDIASDESLLEPPPEPRPSQPSDRYRDGSVQNAPRRPSPAPQRQRVPQPELIAATNYGSSAPGSPTGTVSKMSSEAAALYATQSAATMNRLKAHQASRTQLAARP